MRSSYEKVSPRRTNKCPRCGSLAVENEDYTFKDVGILTRTICITCGFWAANCAYLPEGGAELEYRGFLCNGVVPQDMPLSMREVVAGWRH